MRIMKRAFVSSFACAAVACAMVSFAQDDLDSLLSDLESDGNKKPAATEVKTAAEEPAQPAAEESKPAEAVPALEEEKPAEVAVVAEPASEAEAPKAEPVAEVAKAEPVAAEAATEAEAPKSEPAAEVAEVAAAEPKASKPAEAGATEKEVATFLDDLARVPGESKAEPAAVVAEAAPAPASATTPAAPAATAVPADPNAALVSDLMAVESLRREAMDAQAARELEKAREAMSDGQWDEAYRNYSLAFKHLNDRADTVALRRECAQGMAEARYQAGRQALKEGNREQAAAYAAEAKTLRHPRAQVLVEAIEGDPTSAVEKDVSEIAHRRNDKDFKADRDSIRRRLRRSAQYLAVADLDKALEECELVIRFDPYNSEALALRQRIQRRRDVILDKERKATREGMIADVGAAWRPVYAVNSLELKGIDGGTTRTSLGNDAERTMEQMVEKRMKDMILPSISFRPPATIADAVEYFKQASRDFDRPEIPIDQRGFNFVLDLGKQIVAQGGETALEDSGNDFAANAAATDDAAAAAPGGMPLIPAIAANNVSLWDALKLVCRVTKFKFVIQEGPVVMVMPESMTTEDLVTRTYDVTENFAERMSGAAEDVQDMGGGFGGGKKSDSDDSASDSQEASWKKFFTLMGVKWAEGSSIVYLKTIGKLRVTNTKDQLAVIEAALAGELGATPKLIEIEARFVEVAQEDLNSLGFEWLLNSDYSLGTGKLGKMLGIKGGKWGDRSKTISTDNTESYFYEKGSDGRLEKVNYDNAKLNSVDTTMIGSSGANWSRQYKSDIGAKYERNIGISGDPNQYQSGMRYLNTQGNHISGEGKSVNDQFMRVNAFLGNADLSMILHMLSQRSDTDLLSAPKVLTGPGKEATMKVVTEYIYPTEYDVQLTASGGGSSGGSSSGGGSSEILAVVEPENFTMREVGVILQVTPELSQGGQLINLHLHPQVVSDPTWKNYGMRIPKSSNSQFNAFDSVSGIMNSLVANLTTLGGITEDERTSYRNMLGEAAATSINAINSGENTLSYYDAPMEQPFFKTRSIETDITIANGATVVMGGLITEERKSMEDKIPYLGDLPWIGRFFRSRSEWSNKRNLLIFVTARLVDPMGRQISMGVTEDTAADGDAKVTPAPEG